MTDADGAADPGPDYTRAEALLAQDMPLIPVYHYGRVELIRPQIRGLSHQSALNAWWAKDLYRVTP